MPRLIRLAPLLLLLIGLVACHSGPKPVAWKLEMMTNPKPAVAGQAVLVRVLLTDSDGAAIDGGQATVAFTPPAGSSGLVRVTLAPVGNGIYESRTTLPEAGRWTAALTMALQGRIELQRYPVVVVRPQTPPVLPDGPA